VARAQEFPKTPTLPNESATTIPIILVEVFFHVSDHPSFAQPDTSFALKVTSLVFVEPGIPHTVEEGTHTTAGLSLLAESEVANDDTGTWKCPYDRQGEGQNLRSSLCAW
jgi:hypothetical protein